MRHAPTWSDSLLQRQTRSPVAQLAEHSTVNRRVTGSSPVGGATCKGVLTRGNTSQNAFCFPSWATYGQHGTPARRLRPGSRHRRGGVRTGSPPTAPIDRYLRLSEYIRMELTVAQVAHAYNRSERLVQLALRSGALAGHRTVGRVTTMDDIAARAWSRSVAHGRPWTPEVLDAALDLLSDGHTNRLSASERSRLKARLSSLTARDIAHAAGGLGTWSRYRGDPPDDVRAHRRGPFP